MAGARNHQVLKTTVRFFSSRSSKEGISGGTAGAAGGFSDEYEESDVVWPSSSPPKSSATWSTWKIAGEKPAAPIAAGSVPMSIPDWSKMLRTDRRSRDLREEEDDDEDDDGDVLPPHEMMWRRRSESFSVVEGIGRTLKGRDLSRVRNAVWARTGFQD